MKSVLTLVAGSMFLFSCGRPPEVSPSSAPAPAATTAAAVQPSPVPVIPAGCFEPAEAAPPPRVVQGV
ncbi:MAG: hypothetical protein WCI73_13150, partial [Phycisphaerae bacterium]